MPRGNTLDNRRKNKKDQINTSYYAHDQGKSIEKTSKNQSRIGSGVKAKNKSPINNFK